MKGFDIDGERVLVLNADGVIRACDGICPHQEVLLEEGIFDGCLLTCHSHLWQWNVQTGEIEREAEEELKFFDVVLQEGKIFLATDDNGRIRKAA